MSEIGIRQAATDGDYAAARALIENYAKELDVDLCFQDFTEEIANLSAMYGPPRGCLLLASIGNEIIGCVAVRRHDDQRCEMKRLYVRPQHRGAGVGRQLAKIAIAAAGKLGYLQMLLDTLPQMREAQALYASLGFEQISSYYHNPLPGVHCLARRLGSSKSDSDANMMTSRIT